MAMEKNKKKRNTAVKMRKRFAEVPGERSN